jgi:hypothetical protein
MAKVCALRHAGLSSCTECCDLLGCLTLEECGGVRWLYRWDGSAAPQMREEEISIPSTEIEGD